MSEIIEMNIKTNSAIDLEFTKSSGTNNYNSLTNKPQINGVVLQGNKTSEDIKVQDRMKEISESEIDSIIFG